MILRYILLSGLLWSAAAAAEPRTAAEWRVLAIDMELAGDTKGAIAAYDGALRLEPRDTSSLMSRAKKKFLIQDYTGAIADLDRVLAIEPENSFALSDRGTIRRLQGDFKGALADFDSNLRLDPEDWEGYLERAFTRRAAGDASGALADYDKVLAHDPKDADAHYKRAIIHHSRGDWGKALADYDASIALDDSSYSDHLLRYVVRRQLAQAGAREDLAATIAKWEPEQEQATAEYMLGARSERELLDLVAAKSIPALAKQRQCVVYYYMGITQLLAGNRAKAEEFLAKSVATEVVRSDEYFLAKAALALLPSAPPDPR